MKFAYQARTKEGRIESGAIEASSREAAAALLQKYNLYVTSLTEAEPRRFFLIRRIKFFQKINKKELAIFSRQLAVMIEARLPVVQSLFVLASQTAKVHFQEKIMSISKLLEEGSPLSEALSYFPEIFDDFYINVLKSGETSGKISESLNYLSNHLEREYDIAAQLRAAMAYPIFVLVVMGVAVSVILFGVMPGFVEILEEMEAEIPLFTRMMLAFYYFLRSYGWLLLAGFLTLVAFIIYYLRTKEGKKFYDKFSLRTPFIGRFFQKFFLVRFAENLSTLVSSGVPITRALGVIRDVIGNFVYQTILSETEQEVSEGQKISSVLIRYPDFVPVFVVQMIKIGEDTGKLDKTLMEIVNFYQKEIERSIDTFISLIEPILIIFLGAIIAVLAVSVFMPLYSLIGSL